MNTAGHKGPLLRAFSRRSPEMVQTVPPGALFTIILGTPNKIEFFGLKTRFSRCSPEMVQIVPPGAHFNTILGTPERNGI